MASETLKTLYVDELRDLYDSETQLIKALPTMAEAAVSAQLRTGFEEHLEQTKTHASRIEQILDLLGESPKGKKCKGMRGIIAEGEDTIDEDYEGALRDSALIAAAQRVEHYEIAAYGCVREYARLLGETEAASILEQTLEEEKATDAKLTDISHQINPQAAGAHAAASEGKARTAGA